MGTAWALSKYEHVIDGIAWLVFFIPLVNSCGGNSGNQSATLVITAMSTGDITLQDWARVIRREFLTGLMLGAALGLMGFLAALAMGRTLHEATVLPLTILLVVTCGTLTGSLLPMMFRRLGLDPALMSNPFVASLIDLLGVVIYMSVALALLTF